MSKTQKTITQLIDKAIAKIQRAIAKLPSRAKNPFFWLGILGTILAAGGVDFQTLTSWRLLAQAVLSILANPVALVSTVLCIVGIACDTSTPGLTDKTRE